MKITIIGCWGAYPKEGDATSGYLLETDSYKLLIDCGSGILSKIQKYINLDEIDVVILSHYHSDHIADIFCFQYQAMISMQLGNRKDPLKIFAHDLDDDFKKLGLEEYVNVFPINDNSTLVFDDIKVTFNWNIHPIPSLSMRLQRDDKVFVYTGDTGLSDELIRFAQGADILFSECSLYNSQLGIIEGHLTAGEAGKLASQSGIRKLILTHLPHYGNHDELEMQAKEEFDGEVFVAHSGLIWEL